MPAIPPPRSIVSVRQRNWLLQEAVPPPAPGQSALVKLSCIDDDNQGADLEVLGDQEPDAEIKDQEAYEKIGSKGFDDPKVFSSYYRTIRWHCLTATDPKLFQAPFRSVIKLESYQLEPLRKALQLFQVILFLADDVGLDKTIEPEPIVRELLLPKKVRDIVICCPPSILYQWREELGSRFGLAFEILDKDYVKKVRSERGFSGNPWSTHTQFLGSHRLLIDDAYAVPVCDWLETYRPGSVLILDEAQFHAPIIPAWRLTFEA